MAVFSRIDWGGSYHQVAVVNNGGAEVWNRRYLHNRAGVDELIDDLVAVDGLAQNGAISSAAGTLDARSRVPVRLFLFG